LRRVRVPAPLIGYRVASGRGASEQPNAGPEFASDVAEFFSVAGGKIASLAIYFDSAPFPK